MNNKSVDMVAPLLLDFVDKRALRTRTVAHGLPAHAWLHEFSAGLSVPVLVQYLNLWNELSSVHLVEDMADSFIWICTTSKEFSVKFAYLAFLEGRTLWAWHDPICKCKAPLKFKLFAWKVAWNRCWTGERRLRYGLANDDSWTLCLRRSETIDHLLLQCPFSRIIWFEVLKGLDGTSLLPTNVDGLLEWWPRVLESWPTKLKPQACSLFLLVLRSIWIEQNNRIFKNKSRLEAVLLDAIVEEADRWKLVGFL
jgi:hypothetical protein